MPYVSKFRAAHPSFLQPDDGSVKLWRYLDLSRLVWLLGAKELAFVRLDKLDDRFEGSVTAQVFEAFKANPQNAEAMARIRPQMNALTFVNCWHANNRESEAMWRLYCGAHDGVALQTTYQKLDESLPPEVLLGQVTYLDYDVDQRPLDFNALTPMMHKRAAFEHEREVRALIWSSGFHIARKLQPEEFPPTPDDVFTLPWNAEDTVEHVFVSPYAHGWYRDAVAMVVEKFAPRLSNGLRWSQMKGAPLY